MRTRRFAALVLLPILAGCAGVPRVIVTPGYEGRGIVVWRFKGDEVVGATAYGVETATRRVIRTECATVAPAPP